MKPNLQKIVEARKNRRNRSTVPFKFFIEKHTHSLELLEKINKKIRSRELNQEARRQYIISQVTAFEVYLKEIFIWLIDIKKVDIDQLVKKLELKFNLNDVQFIINKKIKPGELIASHFNFQNLKDIDKAFSILLNIDFIKTIQGYKFYWGEDKNNYFQIEDNFYFELNEFLNLRHNFVHDINFNDFIHKLDINFHTENLFNFILIVDLFLIDHLKKVK